MDLDPASFSSEEDCNASAPFTENSFTEDCIETGSIEDHDHASTSSAEITSSTEESPPPTETRSSALPILSVDLTDLSTCLPPSSLSDDQKYQNPLEHTRTKYRGLPVLSETRWLARVDSIDCLLRNYRAVCEAVEAMRDSSSSQSAYDADSYLNHLSFEFFVSAVICRHVLGFTRPLTVALQAKDCDLYEAHKMAQRLIKTLEKEREADKFAKL